MSSLLPYGEALSVARGHLADEDATALLPLFETLGGQKPCFGDFTRDPERNRLQTRSEHLQMHSMILDIWTLQD